MMRAELDRIRMSLHAAGLRAGHWYYDKFVKEPFCWMDLNEDIADITGQIILAEKCSKISEQQAAIYLAQVKNVACALMEEAA